MFMLYSLTHICVYIYICFIYLYMDCTKLTKLRHQGRRKDVELWQDVELKLSSRISFAAPQKGAIQAPKHCKTNAHRSSHAKTTSMQSSSVQLLLLICITIQVYITNVQVEVYTLLGYISHHPLTS